MYLRVERDKFGQALVRIVNTLGIAGIEDEDFPATMHKNKTKPRSGPSNSWISTKTTYDRVIPVPWPAVP